MLYPVRKTPLDGLRDAFYAKCDEIQRLKNAGRWEEAKAATEQGNQAYRTWQNALKTARSNAVIHTPQDCYQPGWRDPYRLRRD